MRKALMTISWLMACILPNTLLAQPLPREVEINGVAFVHVPEGWFWHAIEAGDVRRPDEKQGKWFREARVWLDGFYIAKFEATARDFARFMASPAATKRDQYAGDTDGCSVRRDAAGAYTLVDDGRNLPATHLSWELAEELTRWMGFRLPTETEWVKAARGTDKRVFPWGNEYPEDTFAGYNASEGCAAAPVDAFENGRSPYGAYNMAGNVYEFVADWYDSANDLALVDGMRNPPPAVEGEATKPNGARMKILKGGRWSSPAHGLSVFRRTMHDPKNGFLCFGVRYAIDETTVKGHLAVGTARVR